MKAFQIFQINSTNPEQSTSLKTELSYNAGAISILSDVAKVKLFEFEELNTVSKSNSTKVSETELNCRYDALLEGINNDPELTKLALNFDTAVCDWNAESIQDAFIQGFLEGYRFLLKSRGEEEI